MQNIKNNGINNVSNPPQFLNFKQACAILTVSKSTVYRLGKSNDLQLVKIGRTTRITRESIEKYLKQITAVSL